MVLSPGPRLQPCDLPGVPSGHRQPAPVCILDRCAGSSLNWAFTSRNLGGLTHRSFKNVTRLSLERCMLLSLWELATWKRPLAGSPEPLNSSGIEVVDDVLCIRSWKLVTCVDMVLWFVLRFCHAWYWHRACVLVPDRCCPFQSRLGPACNGPGWPR